MSTVMPTGKPQGSTLADQEWQMLQQQKGQQQHSCKVIIRMHVHVELTWGWRGRPTLRAAVPRPPCMSMKA